MQTTVIFAENGMKVVVNQATSKLYGELSILTKDGKSTTCQLDADAWATLAEVVASTEVMKPEDLVVETMSANGEVKVTDTKES